MKGGQVGRAGQRKKTGTRGVAPAGPSPLLTAMRHGPASETLCSRINVLPGHLGSETNSALLPAARPPPSTRPENRPLIALEGPFLPPEPRPPLTQRPGCQSSPPPIFTQKTAYEMQSGDWSSDVCSSDLTKFFAHGSFSLFTHNCE